ncbi:hypothetical protein OAF83_01375 [Rubripirellula sp.]|jgi:hypothetical protein|nr:hypothetical protein [Rubripirellula sp.]MDB4749533.1 hypothetical protein [Rubripirellula sp.]
MLNVFDSFGPFTILLALGPLIAYLLVISFVRLSGRALVTTGGRDLAALAMAISGLLAVGPAELFFPSAAATVFGPAVWCALAAFYGLSVSLVVLSFPPKIAVYGRTANELYVPLLAAAKTLDSTAVGDGEMLQVTLPGVGVHLRINGHRGIDYSQIVAFEPNVSLRFWSKLLAATRAEVQGQVAPLPRRGFAMLGFAIVMGSVLLTQSFGKQELLVEGFRDWLWR